MLFDLPQEIRIYIYETFLNNHRTIVGQQQPSNRHLSLLRVCKQMAYEAGDLAGFKRYISLRDERQIVAFMNSAGYEDIVFADVANDGRMLKMPVTGQIFPVSALHLTLRKMVLSLEILRVFSCQSCRPASDFVIGVRFSMKFEQAMFPLLISFPRLRSYQLYLELMTTTVIFETLSPCLISEIRLSGFCVLNRELKLPNLLSLSIHGVTGNYVEKYLGSMLSSSQLEIFQYAHSDKIALELLPLHIRSLVLSPSKDTLTKLVLMGCNKIPTAVLTGCLRKLSSLQYFALSYSAVNELDSNFIASLTSSIAVLKLEIRSPWYVRPFLKEEEEMCAYLEEVCMVEGVLHLVCLYFHDEVMRRHEERWKNLSVQKRFTLEIGSWKEVF